MKLNFDKTRKALDAQHKNITWLSGFSKDELSEKIDEIEKLYPERCIQKAMTYKLILEEASIAIDKEDIFQEKLRGFDLMAEQRARWETDATEKFLKEDTERIALANELGAYSGNSDYGHTSPNSQRLLELGFSGLLERIKVTKEGKALSEKQEAFYRSCEIVLEALISAAKRFSEAIRPYNTDTADAFMRIADGKPENIYEAMLLTVFYFFMHERVTGTRVRTLGRLDLMLEPFYKKDIKNGRFTKGEIKEMLKYFLNKFSAAEIDYGLPFCISGTKRDGTEAVSEITYLIVEAFDEISVYSPKIHVRISDNTPRDFIKLVLRCIRHGNSSFVFVNDNVTVKALVKVGIEENDALDYVPIGCYEPAIWGVEIGCTGNGYVSLPKAIELTLNGGCDLNTGARIGCEVGRIESFDDLLGETKKQIAYMTETAMKYVTDIEGYYPLTNPDPIHSAMYDESVRKGIDLYEGSAKYNNSTMNFFSIASFTDSMIAIKRIVFDEKRLTLEELFEILKNDWQTNMRLRAEMLRSGEKYGNGCAEADGIAKDIASYCASLVNQKPNGRGGFFKASLFSINNCYTTGRKTMATPDGRLAGAPLSKNICASVGMDKNGVTSLINSVTAIDHSDFSNGTVLDIVLHPSTVAGDDGIDAFLGLLETYLSRGGFAMHCNVFGADDLKAAQLNPEKYKNLQVRVCGWNAYFINLTKAEQDDFIKQAEGACL